MPANLQARLQAFGEAGQIELLTQSVPTPGPNEVLVRVEAASLSSTDLTIRKGLYPLLTQSPPFVMGYDFVGRVEQTGEQVETFALGERVASLVQIGGHAQWICVPAKQLVRIQSPLPSVEIACLMSNGMSAYQIFHHYTDLEAGDRFLVHGGSGAIGSLLLQFAQGKGVETVSSASSSKLHFLEDLGAKAISYEDNVYPKKLKILAGERGFDAAIDFTNQRSIRRSFGMLRPEGRLILTGLLNTQQRIKRKNWLTFVRFGAEFGAMMLRKSWWNLRTNRRVYFYGLMDEFGERREQYEYDLHSLCRLVEQQQIQLHYTVYPLQKYCQAQAALEQGKVVGQVVLRMQ
ncbi:MAG: zinc-binding dehydrogenase [Bacteroidota bacterium]